MHTVYFYKHNKIGVDFLKTEHMFNLVISPSDNIPCGFQM